MAKTEFVDDVTVVDAAFLNSIYNTDGGHVHDGADADGSAAKVHPLDHLDWAGAGLPEVDMGEDFFDFGADVEVTVRGPLQVNGTGAFITVTEHVAVDELHTDYLTVKGADGTGLGTVECETLALNTGKVLSSGDGLEARDNDDSEYVPVLCSKVFTEDGKVLSGTNPLSVRNAGDTALTGLECTTLACITVNCTDVNCATGSFTGNVEAGAAAPTTSGFVANNVARYVGLVDMAGESYTKRFGGTITVSSVLAGIVDLTLPSAIATPTPVLISVNGSSPLAAVYEWTSTTVIRVIVSGTSSTTPTDSQFSIMIF